jgi:hypothetical protein
MEFDNPTGKGKRIHGALEITGFINTDNSVIRKKELVSELASIADSTAASKYFYHDVLNFGINNDPVVETSIDGVV